jgi:carboxymethylenebutenolidase
VKIVAALGAAALAGAVGYGAGQARAVHAAPIGAESPDATNPHANHFAHEGPAFAGYQQSNAIPASANTAVDRIAKSPRHGEWVAIKVNATDSVMAWVVYPERKDKSGVVIAIHENTGINTWTRSVADQLAADGFIGIAPDLTTMKRTGDLTKDPTQAEGSAAIRLITPEIGNEIIDAVAKYGQGLSASNKKYGIVGFCWGGGRSFNYATHAPGLGASVVYYGTPPTEAEMANIKAPVLGFYGGADARVSGTVPGTDSTMKKLGKSYEFNIMDGAGHGFLRGQDQSPANLAAATAAWPKTVAFFRAKLGS